MVQASFHMIVTLRVFYYAPPDTVGIEFGTRVYLKTPNVTGSEKFLR